MFSSTCLVAMFSSHISYIFQADRMDADDSERPVPSYELLVKNVKICFECDDEFSFTEFCEDDEISAFDRDAVSQALHRLAETDPQVISLDKERPFVFLKPKAPEQDAQAVA